jgi:GNAT superfamily N-acetyltransferase
MEFEIKAITTKTDRKQWEALYRGYAEFYQVPMPPEKLALVWSWLTDPQHEVGGLVAEQDGRLIALAHHRAFARPLAGGMGLFLDDLFTAPEARGQQVGEALLAALSRMAAERGMGLVRWITAQDNARARGLYDKRALATSWVTYDMLV